MVVAEPAAPQPIQPLTANAGDNIATITGTFSDASNAMLTWGTTTGGPYPNATSWQKPVIEYYDDGTSAFRQTWIIENVQQAADTVYYAVIDFADGSSSSELTWTQPGLNASPNDTVNFYRTYESKFAKIRGIATKASARGWLNVDDWNYLRAAAYYTAFFNTITWEDGR